MKQYLIAFTALLALASCNSDSADGKYDRAASDELINSQIDEATKSSVDSMAKASDKGNILFPLPDTLTSLLAQKRSQATVAVLPDETIANKRLQVENPIFVRGNFDGNSSPDYAVQVLQNDSVQVVAYLNYSGQTREVQVASYPAQQLNGQWYSTYQLKLAPQDSLVRDPRRQQQVHLKTDGITIINGDQLTLYLLQKGRFIPFDAKNQPGQ